MKGGVIKWYTNMHMILALLMILQM
jgi:hypothetical protein